MFRNHSEIEKGTHTATTEQPIVTFLLIARKLPEWHATSIMQLLIKIVKSIFVHVTVT